MFFLFFQAEDGIRVAQESRGLGDVYKRQVYARIKDDKTCLVILNGSDQDHLLAMDRYREVTTPFTRGVEVTSGEVLDLTGSLNVPARGVYVMDLQ